MFELITPVSYWVLTVLWLVILGLYLGKLRQSKGVGGAVAVLLSILAIDAFRTVFESAYFGLYFNSLFGLLPGGIHDVLSRPGLIIIPKLINVAAGFLVVFLLIRHWVPRELREREEWINSLQEARRVAEGRREEAVAHSAKFEAVFNSIFSAVVFTDADHRITSVNPGLEKVFGYTAGDLVGKKISVLYESEAEYERQCCVWLTLSAEEKSAPVEVSYRRKDGRVFIGETLGTEIKGASGETLGFNGVICGITTRTRTESALIIEKEKAEEYLDVAEAIIVVLDKAANVELINRRGCDVLGYAEDEVVGKNWIETFIPEDRRWENHAIRAAYISGDIGSFKYFENVVITKSGELRAIAWHNAVRTDDNGNFIGSLSSGQDITDRKNMEEELRAALVDAERANQAKSEFLASMSHELRTPLNAVLGFAQMLQFDPQRPLSPVQEEHIDSILTGGCHLLDLVNKILDLAMIEADQVPLFLEEVCANGVVEDCVNLAVPLGDARGITVINQFSHRPPVQLRTDQLRFKQALLNLLTNAVNYNTDGGRVVLNCRETEDHFLHISVTDTGIGIAKEDQNNVFLMFHRFGADPMEAREGTGIGLAVTRQLMEKLAGRIGFESEEGVGSTFWIDLPLASNEEAMIWNENLRVGVDAIDKDHQTIISLANKITHRLLSVEGLEDALEALLEFIHHHFKREEAVMEICGYPDLEKHRELHRDLLSEATDLIDTWRNDQDPNTLFRLRKFLRKWLAGHIMHVDTEIADYTNGKRRNIERTLANIM